MPSASWAGVKTAMTWAAVRATPTMRERKETILMVGGIVSLCSSFGFSTGNERMAKKCSTLTEDETPFYRRRDYLSISAEIVSCCSPRPGNTGDLHHRQACGAGVLGSVVVWQSYI